MIRKIKLDRGQLLMMTGDDQGVNDGRNETGVGADCDQMDIYQIDKKLPASPTHIDLIVKLSFLSLSCQPLQLKKY